MIVKINGQEIPQATAPPDTPFLHLPGFIQGPVDSFKDMTDFFHDLHVNGPWHAITGETFVQWADEKFHLLISNSTYLGIEISMILLLLGVFGFKRAGKWLWWTIAIYVILQVLGVAIP
jgi:hypothetical protein